MCSTKSDAVFLISNSRGKVSICASKNSGRSEGKRGPDSALTRCQWVYCMCYKCNFLKPISLLSLAHRRTPNHSSQEQISLNEEMNTQQMIDRKERQPGTCCNNTAHDSVFYLKIIKSNMHAMKHAQKKNESLFHYSFHFSPRFCLLTFPPYWLEVMSPYHSFYYREASCCWVRLTHSTFVFCLHNQGNQK